MAKDFIAQELLDLQNKYLIPSITPYYQSPLVLTRGKRSQLMDTRGKIYIDFFSGIAGNNCGHCQPDIVDSAIEQLEKLLHVSDLYLAEPVIRLAERLARLLPGPLNKICMCCSGSQANEAAALLAQLKTGRRKFLSLDNAYHGAHGLSAQLSHLPGWAQGPQRHPEVLYLELPQTTDLNLLEKSIRENDPEDIAALFIEPIQVPGGVWLPPENYLVSLAGIARQYGILLVVDETFTGFCRTGRWFCFEHADIMPDIVTAGGALANGLPLAFWATSEELAAAYQPPGFAPLAGNPLACQTALSVLDFMERNQLAEKATVSGCRLESGLVELKRKFSSIKCIRGQGLIMGMELEDAEECSMLQEEMKKQGFLVGCTGAAQNVLTFLPPLIISGHEIDAMVDALRKVFEKYH